MPSRNRALVLLVTIFSAVSACSVPRGSGARTEYDVILRHGTILDGTGSARYVADVGIAGGHIMRIGELDGDRARVDIDVSGLMVAPGFINLHSHANPAGLTTAENMLTQGVTTELLNPDGGGPSDLDQQRAGLESAGLALNVGAYVPFNSIWSRVMGNVDRRAAAEDIASMRALVEGGLKQGAFGVSAGLDYKPAYFARVEEVVQALEPARKWRTNFTNHDRLTPETGFSSRIGIGETIQVGERAGLVPVITHMKVQGREQGSALAVLEQMQQATARGHYTAADVYPYLAGQTSLAALIIPGWAQEGGRMEMLKRFQDPALRTRIVAEAEEAMRARFGGPEGVFLPATKKELVDVMRELQVTSGGETVIRLLEKESPTAILRFGSEADLVKIMQHSTAAIACDCGASAGGRGSHPRGYGTYPRVLGRYVREQKALTWEDAVRKMSGLPATIIGMVDRGFVVPGMAADIVVFDSATVIDRATYESPAELSEGIRHVLVNGRVALRDGRPTGERGGRGLKRTINMPSRAMTVGDRRVSVKGADFELDVSQASGALRPKGSFRWTDPGAQRVTTSVELGMLQSTEGWASVSGRARVRPGGEERAFTVIVDLASPGGAIMTMYLAGAEPVSTTAVGNGKITTH